jgi:hypothetical protein
MNKAKIDRLIQEYSEWNHKQGLGFGFDDEALLMLNANGLLTSASVGSALWRDRRGLLTLMTSANVGTARWPL